VPVTNETVVVSYRTNEVVDGPSAKEAAREWVKVRAP
jgi:hypothetical protein